MSNCFRTRLVVTILFTLVGTSLGCQGAPVAPTPEPTPAVPTLPVAVSAISPARGLTGDPVTVAGTGFLPGASLTLDGVAAITTRISSRSISAITPAHSAGTVDVVVTNTDGQSATLPGGYTFEFVSLTASPSLVKAGGRLTMSLAAPSGRSCNGGGDWVALYRVGDPDETGAANGHTDLWFEHLCGATSGKWTLNAPAQPGEYEFRYMVDAFAAARSNPVTVSALASPLIPAARARER